jgi:hypothetical protein
MSKPPEPPERFKKVEDLSVAEHAERQEAERRGETYKPETEEFKTFRNKVLIAGGLPPDRVEEIPLEEMTPEQHFDRMRR